MLFMGNDGFTILSADGLKLFDAAIDWAIGSMKACFRRTRGKSIPSSIQRTTAEFGQPK